MIDSPQMPSIKGAVETGKALSPECVMSRSHGPAAAPKDFDWLRKNIPCQYACPAHTDIPGYLDAIAHGDFTQAYLINLKDNIFPAVLGRVCTRPCEPVCRHGWEGLGDPVAICFSKRSAADFLQRRNPVVLEPLFKPSGKSVAIVGAGAGGLAAARELALWGHDVTVYEKYGKPGGLMVQGIPAFRLPRDVVELEIGQIERLGVRIKCGVAVGADVAFEALAERHDAAIIATGALKPNIPELPGVTLRGVEHGLPFLMKANETLQGEVGKWVVVVGGGFTAMDCARMAKRLGAEQVDVCYRRSEKEMYITGHEIAEMKNEGIGFYTRIAPIAYLGEERVRAVRFVKIRLEAPDESGRACPIAEPGSEFEMPADTVLLGTGQTQDVSWLEGRAGDGLIDPGSDSAFLKSVGTALGLSSGMTSKIFIAGDFATGPGSLIDAIGHARQCARKVDAFLMEEKRLTDIAYIEDAKSTGRLPDMDLIPRQPMPTLPMAERTLTAEVETGLDVEAAQTEATRCYLCHYKYEIDDDLCIYCDRCLKVNPVENCIVKVRSLKHDERQRIVGYEPSTSSRDYNMLYIDQNECIRCGACLDVCPVECISLQKVNRKTMYTQGNIN